MDEEAIYITGDMVTFGPRANWQGLGTRLWIVDKQGLYSGTRTVVQPTSTVHDAAVSSGLPADPFIHWVMQPAQIYGDAAGGVGTFLVTIGVGGKDVRVIRVDNPLSSPTFTHQVLPMGDIGDVIPTYLPAAPQRGTPTGVDTGWGQVLNAVWRDDALYAVMHIMPTRGPDAGQTTVHWVKVDTSALSNLRLADQGNVGGEELGPRTFTAFPSVAVDGRGNMAIGFAAFNSSVYPGAFVTGRRADDPPGTVRPATSFAAGLDSYVRGTVRNRWGDYTGTVPDPAEDGTFWSFGEYSLQRGEGDQTGDGRWATRWARYTLPDVAPGAHRVDLADGQTVDNVDFGFRRTSGSITGTVFHDADADGQRDPDEVPLSGRTVYIDVNRNGVPDGPATAAQTVAALEVPRDLDDGGPYELSGDTAHFLQSTVPGTIVDLNVRVNITHARASELVLSLVSENGTRVLLFNRVGTAGANFNGTLFDDEATRPITQGTAPFNGSYRPQSPLSAFDGMQAAGTWRLEVDDQVAGNKGVLSGWSIVFTTARPAEPSAVTGPDGAYRLTGVPLAAQTVREALPPGWVQTVPTGTAARTVTPAAALPDVTGVDFGTGRDPVPPRVVEVYARGSAWRDAFKGALQGSGLGDAAAGARLLPAAPGAARLRWVNVDQLVLRFDRAVEALPAHLVVRGGRSTYTATAVGPVPGMANAYAFTLDALLGGDGTGAFNGDRLSAELDGHSDAPLRSAGGVVLDGDADGTPGGDFRFAFDVLQGDITGDGQVTADDASAVRRRFFRSPTNPGAGDAAYSVFDDVNGSGAILADDFSEVKRRFFTALPPEGPAALRAAAGVPLARTVTRELFGSRSVLA